MTTTTMTAQVRTGGKFLFTVLAIASGLLLCVQSRINGALGAKLGDAIAASTISFGVGLAAMILLALLVPAVRSSVRQVPRALAQGRFPRWYLVAGAVGALIVFSQAAAVPLIGVALFTVCLVTGQSIGSMFMDRVGFGGAMPRKINALRLLGVVLTIIGVIWAVSPRGADAQLSTLLLPMASTWWHYIGGLLGCLFVGITAMVVKRLGVLVTSLAAVGGQLVGSLLLDAFFPAPGSVITTATVMGTLLTLLAVGLASVSRARNAKDVHPQSSAA
ncbi:DMT family transporter [Glutamicibacter arilaitensis]|uniref:DMT family transporter n=1 Tax=Glutamicibacter arilaitensis TaxID=256701 RepID=UPI003F9724AD